MTPLEKRAERKSRNQTMVDMNLVSLIDVFTILIFFLLSNVGGVETLASPRAVKLPESMVAEGSRRRRCWSSSPAPRSWSAARSSPSVAEAIAVDGDLIQPLKAELDLQIGRQVIRQGQRGRQQARDDHGRQGHPVPAAEKVMVTAAPAPATATSRSRCGRGSSREAGAAGVRDRPQSP